MDRYDYIVVGAGSAGCVIANRLSADAHAKVLIVEAGGPDKSWLYRRPGALAIVYQVPKLKKKVDWGYRTVPQPFLDNREMPWTRGKVLGGCSTVNGMLYLRGNRANYDEWRDMGNPGWGYDDVLPLFNIVITIWSTLLVARWKHREATLASAWGVLNREDETREKQLTKV